MKRNILIFTFFFLSFLLLNQSSSAYVVLDVSADATNFQMVPESGQINYEGDWGVFSHATAYNLILGESDYDEMNHAQTSDTLASVTYGHSENHASVPDWFLGSETHLDIPDGVYEAVVGYGNSHLGSYSFTENVVSLMPFTITGASGDVDVLISLDYIVQLSGDADSIGYFVGTAVPSLGILDPEIGDWLTEGSVERWIEGSGMSIYEELTGTLSETITLQVDKEYRLSWATATFAYAFNEPIPEPSTFLLVGAGLAGVGLLRKRFKK